LGECTARNCLQGQSETGMSDKRIEALGVHANLYKLLLYEEGGHFLAHCDTEKVDGMFGTLVIQLPSLYTGGEFRFSHGGETKTFELSEGSEDTFHYIAFYADCEHQLYPITSGKRLSLAFDLVASRSTKKGAPSHAINADTEAKLQSIAAAWKANPIKVKHFGYRLDHKYTPQSFATSLLKGRDDILYQTLVDAKSSDGHALFDIKLVLMEHYYSYDREYDQLRADEVRPRKVINSKNEEVTNRDDFSVRQVPGKLPVVPDDDLTVEMWKESAGWVIDYESFNKFDCHDGYRPGLDENDQGANNDNEHVMFDWDPDEHSPQEYTGNGGATAEYWYFAAALVLAPT
jgi:2OG-Fe(II) oxygenase superfamily